MENNKVMWIDSNWELFKEMVLGSSIDYLWKQGIDSNVTFLNSNGDREAYFLDNILVNKFMSLYESEKNNGNLSPEVIEFFKNKLVEIKNHENHFYNSAVVPCQREYNIGDVLVRMNDFDVDSFIVRMDLLSTDRDDLIEGVDRDYLSMGLHFYFKEFLNKKCILFTENTDDDVIKKNWEKIYDKNYTKKLVLKKECK